MPDRKNYGYTPREDLPCERCGRVRHTEVCTATGKRLCADCEAIPPALR